MYVIIKSRYLVCRSVFMLESVSPLNLSRIDSAYIDVMASPMIHFLKPLRRSILKLGDICHVSSWVL